MGVVVKGRSLRGPEKASYARWYHLSLLEVLRTKAFAPGDHFVHPVAGPFLVVRAGTEEDAKDGRTPRYVYELRAVRNQRGKVFVVSGTSPILHRVCGNECCFIVISYESATSDGVACTHARRPDGTSATSTRSSTPWTPSSAPWLPAWRWRRRPLRRCRGRRAWRRATWRVGCHSHTHVTQTDTRFVKRRFSPLQ